MAALEGFAVAAPGTADLVDGELAGLGIEGREQLPGGVAFRGEWADLYKANLHCRVATRILCRVARFHAGGYDELARRLGKLPWGEWITPECPVVVNVTAKKTLAHHTGRLADLVTAAVNESLGRGEPAAGDEPVEVHLRVRGTRVTLSLDTSGPHLHFRGYRTHTGGAPLRETLAAACLIRLGYDGTEPLLDPCCGSGTFPIEGALIATRRAPGLGRSFAFERLAGFDGARWEELLHDARGLVRERPDHPIYGADIDPEAVALASRNAIRAGVGEVVSLAVADLAELDPPAAHGLLVANPPYGVRLKGAGRVWRTLGAMVGPDGPFAGWRWGAVGVATKRAETLSTLAHERWSFAGPGIDLALTAGRSEPARILQEDGGPKETT